MEMIPPGNHRRIHRLDTRNRLHMQPLRYQAFQSVLAAMDFPLLALSAALSA
jgi:hypothetical protein